MIEGHLRASYATGDHAYDARFYHAAYLFWAGRIDESKELFDAIHQRADPDYRTGSLPQEDVIAARIEEQTGTIEAVKDSYLFIRFGGWPKALYAHASALAEERIEDLVRGMNVRFRIRFNRKGPMAAEVKL